MTAVRPNGLTVGRSTRPSVGRVVAANRQQRRISSVPTTARRQPNQVNSIAGRNRASDLRTAENRQSFLRNHASERHDHNWHRNWDRHHAHFHNNRVFVFVNGFWWGLFPWDYYPYYAYDYGSPYDDYGNPYDYYNSNYYNGNPYGYYNYYSPYNNDDQSAYAGSDQSAANATVSAVQSELAKLGYYNGAIDGSLGDQTEAALARYQEDNDLSVTGTLDAATLQSLGIR